MPDTTPDPLAPIGMLEARARVNRGLVLLDDALRDSRWDLALDLDVLDMSMPVNHEAHLLGQIVERVLPDSLFRALAWTPWSALGGVELVGHGFYPRGGGLAYRPVEPALLTTLWRRRLDRRRPKVRTSPCAPPPLAVGATTLPMPV